MRSLSSKEKNILRSVQFFSLFPVINFEKKKKLMGYKNPCSENVTLYYFSHEQLLTNHLVQILVSCLYIATGKIVPFNSIYSFFFNPLVVCSIFFFFPAVSLDIRSPFASFLPSGYLSAVNVNSTSFLFHFLLI